MGIKHMAPAQWLGATLFAIFVVGIVNNAEALGRWHEFTTERHMSSDSAFVSVGYVTDQIEPSASHSGRINTIVLPFQKRLIPLSQVDQYLGLAGAAPATKPSCR